MSHIGSSVITIPKDVSIIHTDKTIQVIGKLAQYAIKLPNGLVVKKHNDNLTIELLNNTKELLSLWGTYRSLINNAIIGVSRGFVKKLLLVGIGYRATVNNKVLELKVGFSNIITYNIPEGIQVTCVKNSILYIYGNDLQQVSLTAAQIRNIRKPEPYKGKGIRYGNETIILKQTKKK
jgi:large subunit ribosomal protein L6